MLGPSPRLGQLPEKVWRKCWWMVWFGDLRGVGAMDGVEHS